MRAVFVGASSLTVMTARLLLERGHEVILIERDKERIDSYSEGLDAGFLHGDGSKPAILGEADPTHTDLLFCLTGNDQTNIIAGLVGRSLGFKRVVTKIADPEFEHICIELGLEETIIPSRTIGRYLADTIRGRDVLELSAFIKDEARVFGFIAGEADEQPLAELALPEDSRIICVYRNGNFMPAKEGLKLKRQDEVVILTHSRHLAELRDRWPGQSAREATPSP